MEYGEVMVSVLVLLTSAAGDVPLAPDGDLVSTAA